METNSIMDELVEFVKALMYAVAYIGVTGISFYAVMEILKYIFTLF